MNDLIIKNGLVVSSKGVEKNDILISGGKIVKIGKNIEEEISENINAQGKYIIPGLIDCHVHFRDPGLTAKEDFRTGSMAALAGGVTTIFDMPNTVPSTITIEELERKKKIAKEKCLCDFKLFFGATKDNLNEIKKLKTADVAGIKIFMDATTGDMLLKDKNALENIFKITFEKKMVVAVHAEGNNIKDAVSLAKKNGTKLYLCHISLASEIEYLRKEKDDNIFVEATPHHLFLTKKDEKRLGGFAKMKPSLKEEKDRKALWAAVSEGIVDTIGTDHAPHTVQEKEGKNPPYGVPGVETMLPLLLDKMDLPKIVELCCENPSKIFKLENKGSVLEGKRADLVIVDMNKKTIIKNEELKTKCGWSPFNEWVTKGRIEETLKA